MKTSIFLVGGMAASLCGGALADDVFQIDVDGLSAEASGAFSDTFTGSLRVYNTPPGDPDMDGDAKILDVLVDGVAQGTGGADTDDFYFELNITFSGGKITSGDVTVMVDETGFENTYTASLNASPNQSILDVGGGGVSFIIGGLTFDGMFADDDGTFLGVDITTWGSIQPLPGRFSQIAFEPNGNNEDADTDVDVFVMVPLPGAAAMAGLGLVGLVARRRR